MKIDFSDIIGALATIVLVIGYIPQTVRTLRTRSTKDIAGASFILLSIGALLFMIHGFIVGDYYVVVANLLAASMSLTVVAVTIVNNIKAGRRRK